MDVITTQAEERRYAELQTMALDLARAGESEGLARMIDAGLPVNLADHKGNSLLMLACYHDHEACAAMLLAHGAEVDRRNDRGQTPLGGVAFKGHVGIVRLLLAHGADPEADNGAGATPRFFAALFGRHAALDVLVAAHRGRIGLGTRVLIGWSHLWRRLASLRCRKSRAIG